MAAIGKRHSLNPAANLTLDDLLFALNKTGERELLALLGSRVQKQTGPNGDQAEQNKGKALLHLRCEPKQLGELRQ